MSRRRIRLEHSLNGEFLEVVGGSLPYIILKNVVGQPGLGWISDKDISKLKAIVDEIAKKLTNKVRAR